MENLRSEWLQHPETKRIKLRVREIVQEIQDDWADGKYGDVLKSAYARGRIMGLLEAFEIE